MKGIKDHEKSGSFVWSSPRHTNGSVELKARGLEFVNPVKSLFFKDSRGAHEDAVPTEHQKMPLQCAVPEGLKEK